jgi:hypothetical protein
MGSPLASLVPIGGVPWYVRATVAISGPVAYIIHVILNYRLASMALNKTDRSRVSQVLAVATGQSLRVERSLHDRRSR